MYNIGGEKYGKEALFVENIFICLEIHENQKQINYYK